MWLCNVVWFGVAGVAGVVYCGWVCLGVVGCGVLGVVCLL